MSRKTRRGGWLDADERDELLGLGFLPQQAGLREGAGQRIRRYGKGIARLATARLRALPDFLILGGQRCGTTSLYAAIQAHPQFAPPLRKELHFFDIGFQRGPLWYRAAFPLRSRIRTEARHQGRPVLTGEATPGYLFHRDVPERIARTVPEARLVVVLRDPVERAYSNYWLNRHRGQEALSFEEALAREDERTRIADPEHPTREELLALTRYAYKARGCYADQLERYRPWLPDRMLVLGFDELYGASGGGWVRLGDFLGMDPTGFAARRRLLSSQRDAPEMEPETRSGLRDWFAPHNRRLEQLLGRDPGFG
jgi:hypothetical protein